MTAIVERGHPAMLSIEPEPVHGWLPGAVVWRCAGCYRKAIGFVAPMDEGGWMFRFKRDGHTIDVLGVLCRQECPSCGAINIWPRLDKGNTPQID